MGAPAAMFEAPVLRKYSEIVEYIMTDLPMTYPTRDANLQQRMHSAHLHSQSTLRDRACLERGPDVSACRSHYI
jgi:hypothetical protein